MTSPLQGPDEETQQRMTEIRSRLSAGIPKHPTLDELEAILASEGSKSVEMLPSGEIVAAGLSADARFLLSRVDSLESALREAQKDAERLDWLDDGIQRHLELSRSQKSNKDHWKVREWFIGNERTTKVIASGEGWTLRQAIDAARDAARADTGEST